ncbi:outer membrane protein assembly factor BamE [Aquabacterium sp. A7-Y]|uniref:outer membrane protein assembly factor BamE n=1 Tax=Aquabacterium sp. A7-Y TaxID=1349605 RepID=UPI00223CED7C|nr:outer membrane protein assembly factor BamE [Aquabacterium sp. A7-Y]MCW7536625.1 outer membrane protein assembly factor BamE [Aquabacterium sp. A7-Y]
MPFIIPRGRFAGLLAAAALLATLSACSSMKSSDSVLGLVTPYRIEVVQGNVVTREMAAAVKPGMSRAQVRDILGSPLLTDVFHANRWDYIFTIRRQGAEPQLRRVTAHFDGEQLNRLESEQELPSETAFVASIDTFKKKSGKTAPLELSQEQLQALPAPKRQTGEQAETPPPARTYPPLEP